MGDGSEMSKKKLERGTPHARVADVLEPVVLLRAA
jgi:hypothetical protein